MRKVRSPNTPHLTLEDRYTIQCAKSNGAPNTAIAKTLAKDNSTIGKEIKRYSDIRPCKTYGTHFAIMDCQHIPDCPINHICKGDKCLKPCGNPVPLPCKRRKRVGVCNGCPDEKRCGKMHIFYDAEVAHNRYLLSLSQSRSGLNITQEELDWIGPQIAQLLNNGNSIGSIVQNHPEFNLSEKTLYNYVHGGVFKPYGADKFSVRRIVSRKTARKEVSCKPRKDRKFIDGRKYEDYLKYIKDHPMASEWQMDTVYNDIKNGPFIQTLSQPDSNLMIARLHDTHTAAAIVQGLKDICEQIGEEQFAKTFEVILTDRDSEFSAAEEMEQLGCRIFYCDPMHSWEKPQVENNHILLRYICLKKKDLRELGLTSQEDLDLIFSHINSYLRKKFKGKYSFDVFRFYFPYSEILEKLNIKKIDPDSVILTPSLLKK